ncbi:MAG: NAD-dependent epimerase/dehydratase family protein [Jatrophihabitans sp.]|uniref:NAD-dependent epimerase/dehydratase family protein n=1 Tax=Jatrophihabitans sp. TaxID=1932789 RepID=UPI003F7EC04E
MDVLVLGGSVFLGRAVVDEALALGASVTVFNRGRSGAAPAGVTQLVGDRSSPADLEQLRGRRFDLVVDTCGYVPADVAASAAVLAPTVGHYAFVSSISVYPAWPEDAEYWLRPTFDGDPDATGERSPENYGRFKVGCELAVQRALGDRCSLLRAGAIVGPHDSAVGRLPWWLDRVARAGEVLVPGAPGDPMAVIDARDLARFALIGASGTFVLPGAPGRDTRADLMAACVAATGASPELVWVADGWLAAQDVAAWTELPLWAPGSPGLFEGDVAQAEAAGMRWRPLAETVADTWAWQRSLPSWRPTAMAPGLAPQREADLIAGWRSHEASAPAP